MGRRREHDLEAVLDHARALWSGDGRAALTIRALSASCGMSNGAIYHAFGSRDGLLARTWAREAARFLTHQRAAVSDVLAAGGTATEAVVAAACAPATYASDDEDGARLLLSVRPDDLVTPNLSAEQVEELAQLRRDVETLVRELAERLWGRTDRDVRATIRHCLVGLPSALLLEPGRVRQPLAREVLTRAVRGVVSIPPT